jgi:hypothetical protein
LSFTADLRQTLLAEPLSDNEFYDLMQNGYIEYENSQQKAQDYFYENETFPMDGWKGSCTYSPANPVKIGYSPMERCDLFQVLLLQVSLE